MVFEKGLVFFGKEGGERVVLGVVRFEWRG